MTQVKISLVDKINVTRDYGFDGVIAIVDHADHGRLLIEDGYGGEMSLDGGCVRWRHGSAYQLQADDTFETLNNLVFNNCISGLDVATKQLDQNRSWIDWDGHVVEKIAKLAGL